MEQKKIAVLGAGTMGHGIAQVYASAGYEVALYSRKDSTLQRAKELIQSSLWLLMQRGLVDDAIGVAARIRYTTDLKDAVQSAWYVVETISERPELKQHLYEQLDGLLAEDVMISSNTSYLNIFELMPPARLPYTAIIHWFAPPQIIPLVEVVKGPETTDDVMDTLVAFHKACGKKPVQIKRYIPGFIINRLQSAMTQEVVYLIENGLCSKEDIDLAVRTSIMPRGMLLGVVQRMDFGGLDVVANGLENKKFIPAPTPERPRFIFEPYEQGNLGVKTGKGLYDYTHASYAQVIAHRDQQLLELLQLAEKFLEDPLHNAE